MHKIHQLTEKVLSKYTLYESIESNIAKWDYYKYDKYLK